MSPSSPSSSPSQPSSSSPNSNNIKPRIIIHGGAGNITRQNLTPTAYEAYKKSLLRILASAYTVLAHPQATALDVATYAVSLLEDDPLFNAGKGAVFTRDGTNELEASVMVSSGYRKRGVGCMLVKHVKNPIRLAREMLIRGESDDGGGAHFHSQLSGDYLEGLAREWGLEMCEQEYYFTQRRWDEHIRGLEKSKNSSSSSSSSPSSAIPAGTAFLAEFGNLELTNEALGGMETISPADESWDGKAYLPQGTVGAVVLDRFGTVCVATSTGGLTNKLPGRIGDTPTLGAGFWAEEWSEQIQSPVMVYQNKTVASSTTPYHSSSSTLDKLSRGDLPGLIASCFPGEQSSGENSAPPQIRLEKPAIHSTTRRHAVAMSGTGNGDSFLRTSAARTAAAISRFSTPNTPLALAVSRVAGPGGELQQSAGSHWGKTGEGEGGIIGIELIGDWGKVVHDFNCGGMFRAWVDDEGQSVCRVFREEF